MSVKIQELSGRVEAVRMPEHSIDDVLADLAVRAAFRAVREFSLSLETQPVGVGRVFEEGFCYRHVFSDEFVDSAITRLGRAPLLTSIVAAPSEWKKSRGELEKVVVSLCDDAYIHFESGCVVADLNAWLVLELASHGAVGSGSVPFALDKVRVGGSFRSRACAELGPEYDCRAAALKFCGLPRLAVWGESTADVRASPGWGIMCGHLVGLISPVFSKPLIDPSCDFQNAFINLDCELCVCWHRKPHERGCVIDRQTGLLVVAGGIASQFDLNRGCDRGVAWENDASHVFDVRRLFRRDCSYSRATGLVASLITRAARADYVLEVLGEEVPSGFTPERWFCLHYGEIRSGYLRWVAGTYGLSAIHLGNVLGNDLNLMVSPQPVSSYDSDFDEFYDDMYVGEESLVDTLGGSLPDDFVLSALAIDPDDPGFEVVVSPAVGWLRDVGGSEWEIVNKSLIRLVRAGVYVGSTGDLAWRIASFGDLRLMLESVPDGWFRAFEAVERVYDRSDFRVLSRKVVLAVGSCDLGLLTRDQAAIAMIVIFQLGRDNLVGALREIVILLARAGLDVSSFREILNEVILQFCE